MNRHRFAHRPVGGADERSKRNGACICKYKYGRLVTTAASAATQTTYCINWCVCLHAPKFHLSPVVVVLLAGAPIGMIPQCRLSTGGVTWMSWWIPPGSRNSRLSGLSRMIRMPAKVYKTLMLLTSWSNLPPRAPTTSSLSCDHVDITWIQQVITKQAGTAGIASSRQASKSRAVNKAWAHTLHVTHRCMFQGGGGVPDVGHALVEVGCVLVLRLVNHFCALQCTSQTVSVEFAKLACVHQSVQLVALPGLLARTNLPSFCKMLSLPVPQSLSLR